MQLHNKNIYIKGKFSIDEYHCLPPTSLESSINLPCIN